MSITKPNEGFLFRGGNRSSRRLSLNSAGDHNGNDLAIASSSSCSSSCLGELSPQCLRSLSSLSWDRTDSPLDYDMFEVTLMATEMTRTDKMTDLVISKWVPEKEDTPDDNDDVPVGKIQTATELSESNDNSESVYLDANSCVYCQDTWDDNDNLTLALSQVTNSSSRYNTDELSTGSSNGRRHGSSASDSDVTEIPADDDDDVEEALFLSVSSDMSVRKRSMTLTSLTSQLSNSLINPGCSAATTEGFLAVSGADDESSELVVEGFGVPCPLGLLVGSQTEPPASDDLCKTTQIFSLSCAFINLDKEPYEVISPPLEEVERCAVNPPTTSWPARAAKRKPTTAVSTSPKTAVFTTTRPPIVEKKRFSKLHLKDVEAKVGSRSPLSSPKTPNQNKDLPANGKRVTGKEEAQTGDRGKKQRSSANPVKVAVVRKSIRVKCQLKINHRSAQSERKSLVVSQTLSTFTSSLGSELVKERPLDTIRKAVQEVPDKHETTGGLETKHPSEDAHGGIEKALKTEAAVEKTRNPSRKVSSKLGPSARQRGRGTRVDKRPLGPAPPPGSVTGTGPPVHGSPRPKQTQSDGSTLGEGEQSAVGGSSTRPSQSQSQGILKPHTNAERASVLAAPDPATSNSKPTANQQPVLGAVKRAATPATSKLPVKGLPTSLSSSALGSEISAAISKGASAPTGTKPDEQPSKSTLPVGNQCTAKPLISRTAATTSTNTSSDVVPSGVTAAPKPPALRSRALSLQARTTATGLKTPTVTNNNTAKTSAANQVAAKTVPAANHGLTKQVSQYPLQRSSSARLSRLNSAVDKNKPREAPARPTNSSSQVAAPGGGNSQKKHQPPPDLVPQVVSANAAVTAVVPVPETETTNTGSGTTGASGLAFKAKTGSRSSPKTGSHLQNASKAGATGTVVADRMVTVKQNQNKEQAEKKNQAINQLRKMLIQGNKRVEALATVIQHLFTEREEALKQKKGLSLELSNLREELVLSSQCCERLQKEKEEVRISLEEALNRQEEHHNEELVQLEDRLRSFYQTEWDKVHQTYQEEADKFRLLMEQQVEELRSQQEAERKNQKVCHSQNMESLKLEYETSTQELKRIQQTDLENLNKTLKETETSLSEKISELSAEKAALNEKLKAEEERRKQILTDKNLKDSHTVYLEQELESLKVVLEIKNNQLHHKEKKLMEMDKLLETNVKLQECLTKVQQENEDYKARMDKHAALSKQLSSEQAILQQTLQKESKVNKRLSMENEELLWKLHNGDLLASPRRLSPTSPFNSPQNSASFPSTAAVSPR
ncbi:microtubule-associated tumor suppressor 1 homolog isoform X2 [Etheostoma cragini]|uniref:microtubule-associated tumor suppressor 1 homolog isoform X2 n=1 Tax=Etheostoma cragini TaxID=417921 RepID=UPI00155EDFCF|nr:microtubule-associated tumor suppressor 1 homolog isoform X2 [Etheostoma cragini]